MQISLLLLGLAATVRGAPQLDSRAAGVCSTGLYGELSILRELPAAQIWCQAYFPVQCTPVKAKRAISVSTTTTINVNVEGGGPGTAGTQSTVQVATTKPTPATQPTSTSPQNANRLLPQAQITTTTNAVAPLAKAPSDPANARATAFSRLQAQGRSFVSTLCSCIATAPAPGCKASTTTTSKLTTTRVTTTTTAKTVTTTCQANTRWGWCMDRDGYWDYLGFHMTKTLTGCCSGLTCGRDYRCRPQSTSSTSSRSATSSTTTSTTTSSGTRTTTSSTSGTTSSSPTSLTSTTTSTTTSQSASSQSSTVTSSSTSSQSSTTTSTQSASSSSAPSTCPGASCGIKGCVLLSSINNPSTQETQGKTLAECKAFCLANSCGSYQYGTGGSGFCRIFAASDPCTVRDSSLQCDNFVLYAASCPVPGDSATSTTTSTVAPTSTSSMTTTSPPTTTTSSTTSASSTTSSTSQAICNGYGQYKNDYDYMSGQTIEGDFQDCGRLCRSQNPTFKTYVYRSASKSCACHLQTAQELMQETSYGPFQYAEASCVSDPATTTSSTTEVQTTTTLTSSTTDASTTSSSLTTTDAVTTSSTSTSSTSSASSEQTTSTASTTPPSTTESNTSTPSSAPSTPTTSSTTTTSSTLSSTTTSSPSETCTASAANACNDIVCDRVWSYEVIRRDSVRSLQECINFLYAGTASQPTGNYNFGTGECQEVNNIGGGSRTLSRGSAAIRRTSNANCAGNPRFSTTTTTTMATATTSSIASGATCVAVDGCNEVTCRRPFTNPVLRTAYVRTVDDCFAFLYAGTAAQPAGNYNYDTGECQEVDGSGTLARQTQSNMAGLRRRNNANCAETPRYSSTTTTVSVTSTTTSSVAESS